MSLPSTPCNVCTDPGRCCRRFHLSGLDFGFRSSETRLVALVAMAKRFLPFIPNDEVQDNDGLRTFTYSCPALDPWGRCSIYEHRPDTCRIYAAGSDALCVYYSPPQPFQPQEAPYTTAPTPDPAPPAVIHLYAGCMPNDIQKPPCS